MASPQPQHEHSGQFSLAASIIGFCTAAIGFLRGRKDAAPKSEEDLRHRLVRLERRFDRLETAVLESQATQARVMQQVFEALQARPSGNGS